MVARTTYRGDNKIAKFYVLHRWTNFNHLSKRLMSNNQVIAPFRWSTKAERSDPFIGATNTNIKHTQFDVRRLQNARFLVVNQLHFLCMRKYGYSLHDDSFCPWFCSRWHGSYVVDGATPGKGDSRASSGN